MSETSSPPHLTGRDRRALRRQAHALRALIQVGSGGINDGLIAALDTALCDHVLVKVEIVRDREERELLADELAERTGSAVAGRVGHMAILYRPAPDPERRRIALAGDGA
jgi:RNA-binding protein